MPKTAIDTKPFKVHIFGGPRVEVGGEPASLSPAQATLLGLIALHEAAGVSRSSLKDLLWDSGTDRELTPRLNQLIHMTRKRLDLGNGLVSDGDLLRLDPEIVGTDLEDFQRLLVDGDVQAAWALLGKGVFGAAREGLSGAVEMISRAKAKELKAQLHIESSARWERAADTGDWERADGALSVLARMRPDDQELLQHRMTVLSILGRPEQAKAICAEFFKEEAQLIPTADTLRILEGLSTVAKERAQSRFRGPLEGRHPPILVGREKEMRALNSVLNDRDSNSIRMVLISGPQGIGKSRLVAEALRPLEATGRTLLSGACRPLDREIPLAPLLRAMESHSLERAVDGMDLPWRELVLDFMPLLRAGERSPPVTEQPHRALPHQVSEAFTRLLAAVAGREEAVVTIEDLQWADPLTLRVLASLSRWRVTNHFPVLLTLRSTGLQANPQSHLATFFAEVEPVAFQLELSPLDRAATRRMIETTSGKPVGREILDLLLTASGGVPHIALLALEGEQVSVDDRLTPDRIARQVGNVVRHRLDRLDPKRREVLLFLASLGHSISLEVISLCLRMEEEVLAGLLTDLSDSGWIISDRPGHFVSQPALQEFVVEYAPDSRQVLWYLRYGEWLVGRGDHASECLAAGFYLKGGRIDEAVSIALSAATEALTRGTSETLAPLIARMAEQLTDEARRRDLLGTAGKLYQQAGMPHQAIEAYAAAYKLAVSSGESRKSQLPLLVGRVCSEAQLINKDLDPFLADLQVLQRECLDHNEFAFASTVTDVMLRLAVESFDSAKFQRGIDLAERLLEQKVLSPEDRLPLLLTRSTDLAWGRSLPAAKAVCEALVLAKSDSDPSTYARAINWKIVQLYHEGALNSDEGLAARAEAEEVIAETGDSTLRFRLPLNLGAWFLDTCDLTSSQLSLARAEAVLEGRDVPKLLQQLQFNRADLLLHQGDYEEAAEVFRSCLGAFAQQSAHPMRWLAQCGLSVALARSKGKEKARQQLQQVRRLPDDWIGDSSLYHWAQLETARESEVTERLRRLDGAAAEARLRSKPWFIRLALLGNGWRARKRRAVNASQLQDVRAEVEGLSVRAVESRIKVLGGG